MREIQPLKRKEPKKIEIQNSENVKQILNILNHMIAGKRFGELDSSNQMYLLDCQARIDDMEKGYYTEVSLDFLNRSIDGLLKILLDAKKEIQDATKDL